MLYVKNVSITKKKLIDKMLIETPRRTFYALLFLITSFGCVSCLNNKAETEKIQFIIGDEKIVLNSDPVDPTEPPPPPPPFYGSINLILLGKSDIYLHRVRPFYFIDPDYTDRPMEIALTKWDIVKIDLNELPVFLAAEYKNAKINNNRQHTTCIKSSSDTIISDAFPIIKSFFKDIDFNAYIIRKYTDQERDAIRSLHSD